MTKNIYEKRKTDKEVIIDNHLKQTDWNVTDRTQVIEEFDIHLLKNQQLHMPDINIATMFYWEKTVNRLRLWMPKRLQLMQPS